MVQDAVLEITVSHRPFSDQFQYLTDQNSFCSDKFTVHFQWEAINILVKSSNLLKTSDQFLNLISGTAGCQYLYNSYKHTGIVSLMKTGYLHIDHQFDVWHLAKSVTKKLGKRPRKSIVVSSSHVSSLFLATCGGLRKHLMVMQNCSWRNGNLLCTIYPMSTSGTLVLMHCSQNVCIQHCFQ